MEEYLSSSVTRGKKGRKVMNKRLLGIIKQFRIFLSTERTASLRGSALYFGHGTKPEGFDFINTIAHAIIFRSFSVFLQNIDILNSPFGKRNF